MFPKFEVDFDYIKAHWEDEDDRNTVIGTIDTTLEEFKEIEVRPYFADLYIGCLKGHSDKQLNSYLVDYGYALTAESIEKYLLDKYADDPNEYMVTASLMSMDYEKYYKEGCFIDLEGQNTHEDFWALDDCEELEKKAQFEGQWIKFSVYDVNKGR